ncbi:MAG: hypothetical protein IPQ05_20600 [Leptospiraceae bacterium]|nr:hypothetical protein [Leptospiraceae bacterium]MBK7054290.1 hypothetical protein [Leptospiraceae bacterium]MBK9499588.1 hypothetical protein [Leptospiraceae bacterium]MBL0266196.1 hypothetical protein [Leptospiraceae bacterium]
MNYQALIIRSALILKLLRYYNISGIIVAVITNLPEFNKNTLLNFWKIYF